jgi:hypothetical protein
MNEITNPTTQFAVGDRIAALSTANVGPQFRGQLGTVSQIKSNGYVLVDWDNEDEIGTGGIWHEQHLTKVEWPSGPVAALKHETSRAYARKAKSRSLAPWANKVLTEAADGESVDVLKFRKAATQALSLAATRDGVSTGRRKWATEARHLLHWADAIIDQHVGGLPIYEPGARSPRIRELEALHADVAKALADAKRELDHQSKVNQSLTRDLTGARQERSTLTQAASDERRRLCAEIDGLKRACRRWTETLHNADVRIADLIKEKSTAEVSLEDATRDRDHFATALEYALSLLPKDQRERVFGFQDGLDADR